MHNTFFIYITALSIWTIFTIFSLFQIENHASVLIIIEFFICIILSTIILVQDKNMKLKNAIIKEKEILINTNKQMQKYQEGILNNISDKVWLKNTEGKYIAVNKAFSRAIGLTLNNIIGKTDFELYQNKEIANKHIKEDSIVVKTKEQLCIETPFLDNFGKYSTMEVIKTPIFNDHNAVIGIVGIGRDITVRKYLQEQLTQKNMILEEKEETLKYQNKALLVIQKELNLSLRTLEDINLRLQQANHHKNFFLSTMSHEIRTPLTAIIGFAQALKLEYFGKLNETQSEYIDLIKESGTHLILLINDILDIAKIDSGSMPFTPECIHINDCVVVAIELMRDMYKTKNISLECIINDDIELIVVDKRKFKQILINLLSNALKYTPEGGKVQVKTEKTINNKIKISVIDTGIGIDSKNIDKIFIDFYQLDEVKDQSLGGVGIGLALSKRLVEMHNGEIGVESEPNKGSTFWYTIPAKIPCK